MPTVSAVPVLANGDSSNREELLRLREENRRLRERNASLEQGYQDDPSPSAATPEIPGGDEAAGVVRVAVVKEPRLPLRAAYRNARMLPPVPDLPQVEPADAADRALELPECGFPPNAEGRGKQDPSSAGCVTFFGVSDVPASCLEAGWAAPRGQQDGAMRREVQTHDARGWGSSPSSVREDGVEDTPLFGRRTTHSPGRPQKVRPPAMIGAKHSNSDWRREAGAPEAPPPPAVPTAVAPDRLADLEPSVEMSGYDHQHDRCIDQVVISRGVHDAEAWNSSTRSQVYLDDSTTPRTSERLLPTA